MNFSLVISCEHGGNRIPAPYQALFESDAMQAQLASHRGFDPGALVMAKELADRYGAPLVSATTSRLLIDLNRSLGHPNVFSPQVRSLPQATRDRIVEACYRPYRARVEQLVGERADAGHPVLHLSCHSFTPELYGEIRRADIGLLYDPARVLESQFCRHWQHALTKSLPDLRIRRNYPYQGRNDGLTRDLRRLFSADRYLGIEVEINQKLIARTKRGWQSLREGLMFALTTGLQRSIAP